MARLDVMLKLLFREKRIAPRAVPQIILSLLMALLTAIPTAVEYLSLRMRIGREKMEDPVFITGHWRSGTTLVQYLMAQDRSFGHFDPVFYFSYNFYYLLGWLFRPVVKASIANKRPQDNMRLGIDLPLEEYMTFAKIEADSIYPVNYFPRSFDRFMNNIYWQDMAPEKARRLKKKYDLMLKKCSMHVKQKRLLLKSPDNTGRIGALYEMYPNARFINIYRNPYAVIRSTLHLYESVFGLWTLQDLPSGAELEDKVIDNFARMYRAYFGAIDRMPAGSYYEIRFEDFEKDPYPYLREAYEKLGLGDYAAAEPGFKAYMEAEKNYKKNEFDYPEDLMRKVDEKLGFYFDRYGYERGNL